MWPSQNGHMKQSTSDIVQTALRADGSISEQRLNAAIAFLREGKLPNAKEQDRPLLLSQAEAARLTNCSRFTILRLERAGKLKPVYITPGLKRYRRADLEAFAGGIT